MWGSDEKRRKLIWRSFWPANGWDKYIYIYKCTDTNTKINTKNTETNVNARTDINTDTGLNFKLKMREQEKMSLTKPYFIHRWRRIPETALLRWYYLFSNCSCYWHELYILHGIDLQHVFKVFPIFNSSSFNQSLVQTLFCPIYIFWYPFQRSW